MRPSIHHPCPSCHPSIHPPIIHMHTRVLQDAGDGRYPHSRDPASTSAPDNRRGSARERSAMHGHGRAGRGQPAWHGMGSKGWAQSLDWTATENGDPPKRMERQKSDRRWLIGPFWGRYPAGHRGRWRSFGPKRQRWGGSPLPGCLHCPPAQAGTYLPWRASPGRLPFVRVREATTTSGIQPKL